MIKLEPGVDLTRSIFFLLNFNLVLRKDKNNMKYELVKVFFEHFEKICILLHCLNLFFILSVFIGTDPSVRNVIVDPTANRTYSTGTYLSTLTRFCRTVSVWRRGSSWPTCCSTTRTREYPPRWGATITHAYLCYAYLC